MDNELDLVDTELINLAIYIAKELNTSSPVDSGNMQRSINVLCIDGNVVTIGINVDYASYVNDYPIIGSRQGEDGERVGGKPNKNFHWVQKVLDRCSRAYSQNNVDDLSEKTGFSYEVISTIEGE